jgi:hypothetical protein
MSFGAYGGYGGGFGGGSYGGGGGGFGGGGGQFGGGQGRDLDSIQLRKEDFRGLPAFEKNFYHEHPAVTARSDVEIAAYRDKREIHIEGHDVPKPVTTFEEASFPGRIDKAGHYTCFQHQILHTAWSLCRVCFGRGQQGWLHGAHTNSMSRLANGVDGARLNWSG